MGGRAVLPEPVAADAAIALITASERGFPALDPTRESSSWFRDAGYQTGFVGKFLLFRAAVERDWPMKRWGLALLSSLLPFGTFVFDRSLGREIASGTPPTT